MGSIRIAGVFPSTVANSPHWTKTHLILDGKLFSTDRAAEQVTSVKGKEIDAWYSGKHHRPGGNVQAIMRPDGLPLWTSEAEPGHLHDITAARLHVLPPLLAANRTKLVLAQRCAVGAIVPNDCAEVLDNYLSYRFYVSPGSSKSTIRPLRFPTASRSADGSNATDRTPWLLGSRKFATTFLVVSDHR